MSATTTKTRPLPTKGMSPRNRNFGRSFPVDHPRQQWWSDNTIVCIIGAAVAVSATAALIFLNRYFTLREAAIAAHQSVPAAFSPSWSLLIFALPLLVGAVIGIKRGVQLLAWRGTR